MATKSLEDFLQMFHVLFTRVRFDDNIVHIDFNVSTNHVVEDVIHQPLVGSSDLFDAKWHDLIVEVVGISPKSHFLFISRMDLDLIVPRECIEKTEDIVACCSVNESIDGRQRIGIFRTCFIKINVIYTSASYH